MVSGLKVNIIKSLLVGIDINQSWFEEVASVLNCKVGTLPFKYFGLPIGGDPRIEAMWKPVVDAVRSRLSGWNNRYISIGGRNFIKICLVCITSLFFFSFFKALLGIISKLESIFKNFLWGLGRGI